MRVGIPRAIAGGLGMKFDVVNFGQGVGPRFQTEARVIKIADGEGFEGGGFSRLKAEAAIINLGVEGDRSLFDTAEKYAAAAIVGEPAGDDAIARMRVGQRQPDVAARVFVRGEQTAGAQGLHVRDGMAWIETG